MTEQPTSNRESGLTAITRIGSGDLLGHGIKSMKIHLIIGQRKERYLGEYAPEVLDAIDEYGNDENAGEWIEGKMKEYKADESFEAVEVVTVEVPVNKIMERLRPKHEPIAATVVA